MTAAKKYVTGATRFERFRNTLRGKGDYSWQCQTQKDNLEIWRVQGPSNTMRVIALIGEDGFDLFFESQTINFAEDHAAIQAVIG